MTALGFGPDRIRTLVSMAAYSSHRAIMGGTLVTTIAPSFLSGSSLLLQVTDSYKISDGLEIWQDPTRV